MIIAQITDMHIRQAGALADSVGDRGGGGTVGSSRPSACPH